jgi:hypothetical protein
MNITKRLTRDTSYVKPKKTYQETLTKEQIKDKLKDYKLIEDFSKVPLNTHIRYFSNNIFRLGGFLTKIDEKLRYIVLSNNNLSWSVQLKNNIFYKKMNNEEMKEEIKEELMGSMVSSNHNDELEDENLKLKKLNKDLENKLKKYESKLKTIEKEIKKQKK